MALAHDPIIIKEDSLLTLFDKRTIGSFLPYTETYEIPTSGLVLLREAPEQLSATIPTGVTVTQVPGGPFAEVALAPASGQFAINYTTGVLTFNTGDATKNVSIQYNGRGSVVSAAHINTIITPLTPFYNKLDGIVPDGGVDFTFPNDVEIAGNLNIVGKVNKKAAEVLDLTDDILFINSGEGSTSGPNMGIELARSAGAQGSAAHPQLLWKESDDSWNFLSTSAGPTASQGFELFKVRDAGGAQLMRLTTAQETTFVGTLIAGDQGTIWFNTDTSQFKGYNGTAQIILG